MISECVNAKILVTSGGDHPAVDIYDPINDHSEQLMSLPDRHSVYAVDVSPDGDSIAVGTRMGQLRWLTPAQQAESGQEWSLQEFNQGAGVLSVCFLDSRNLAVSDTADRCFLWQYANIQPKKLPTGNRIICSLFRLDCNNLVGLSSTGELLLWNWSSLDLSQVLNVPAPPVLYGLVKLIYWPKANSLVWPGQDGNIALFSLDGQGVRTISAHDGDVYAIMLCNDTLMTIGRTDNCLKYWQAGLDELVSEYKAPEGIISATVWDYQHIRMLLINDFGQAGIFELLEDGPHLVQQLSGQYYRIVIGPEMEKLKVIMQQQETEQAEKIAIHINEQITRQQCSGLETYYDQLDGLGYRHVALSLRVQEARSKNDLVGQLEIYHELANIIDHEHPGSRSSLVRYAELLESVWMLSKACELHEELADRYPENRIYKEAVRMISGYANLIRSDRCVIEPDIPLLSLVESAIVLGERFRGCYLVEAREQVSCKALCDADEFIKKYEQVCLGKPQMPTAERTTLRWLSKDKNEQITTVVFKDKDSDCFSHIEWGIKFLNAKLQTILVPVIMLNAGRKNEDTSKEQCNQAALEVLRFIEDERYKGYLEMVGYIIDHTVRRLITEKRAERSRLSGAM